MQYKSTPLELVEIKAGSDGMQFTAYASTFGNVDHGGDVIEKGAFKASLKARTFRPLLWQHNMDEPIGVEKALREDSKGLIGTWELVDTPRGADAYKLLKAGAVRSMSIGYIPEEFGFEEQGDIRVLKQVDLLENSVVSLPMNEQALVTNVKHGHCATCAALLAHDEKELDYEHLSLKELASIVAEVAGTFGERTRDLLNKLQAGEFSLTESKRSDLLALLETFSGLDAVRSDAEAVLQVTPEQKETPDPKPGQSAFALAIQLRRARMRARGVEV